MNIPRVTAITLGVADLEKSRAFYKAVFDRAPNEQYGEIAFFELPGAWVTLYPLEKLAEDISPRLAAARDGFSGFTLAYNARSKEEVLAIFERVRAEGGVLVKPPQDVFWGGFSGYFSDPDGYFWEVLWGPMFDFTADGSLSFKK